MGFNINTTRLKISITAVKADAHLAANDNEKTFYYNVRVEDNPNLAADAEVEKREKKLIKKGWKITDSSVEVTDERRFIDLETLPKQNAENPEL